MAPTYTITFQPGDVRVGRVPEGESILRAGTEAGVQLHGPCGGTGSCGRCKVQVVSGDVRSERSARLDKSEWDAGIRLACEAHVFSDVELFLPQGSRMSTGAVTDHEPLGVRRSRGRGVVSVGEGGGHRSLIPVVQKRCMQLKPPAEGDNVNDLARFKKGLRDQFGLTNVSVDSIWIRNMPSVLREQDWLVTATVVDTTYGYKVINLQAGDQSAEDYAVVLDIGTTTVWGQLLDLRKGTVVAQASAYNGQIRFGEDVISRIVYAQQSLEHREELQDVIVDTINEVLDELVRASGLDRSMISHMMAAGNTTMTCLLVGIDPKYLRMAPYVPPADFIPPVRAVNLGAGIKVGRHCHLYTFPSVASFVGGDIVSGIVGSGVYKTEKITLYIDIGTNGEVVVGNKEWLIAASCSAGPAFEGGGIRHGMRATQGAIESVHIDEATGDPVILTIGDAPPLGICGSGIIDAVAELLKSGLVSQNGRFNVGRACPRCRLTEGASEFLLVEARYSGTGQDIVITEADIDNVIRAKGAIFAGIQTLLDSVALSWSDVEQVYVAGGFGKYLRIEQAQAIGMFPELEDDRFTFVGNGSLLGARLGAFSKDMLKAVQRVATTMTNVELSEDPTFMERYVAAMFLPHTDMTLFPEMEATLAGLSRGRID